jgi:hypothetical protein
MDDKLLTENAWKAVAAKFKVKDNGLQRALASYEKLHDDQLAERLKALESVDRFAGTLKKTKEVAAVPEVVKYLAEVLGAVDAEQREIAKARALAAKTSRGQKQAGRKRSEEATDGGG